MLLEHLHCSAYLHSSGVAFVHEHQQDENAHGKKQKITNLDVSSQPILIIPNSMATLTNTAGVPAFETTTSMATTNEVVDCKDEQSAYQQQELQQEHPLQINFPVRPSVIITAFTYQHQAGLVPSLATVMQEAEHISVSGSQIVLHSVLVSDIRCMTRR